MAKRKKTSGGYVQTTVPYIREDGTEARKNIKAKTVKELNQLKEEYAAMFKQRKEAMRTQGDLSAAMKFSELQEIFFANYTSHLTENVRYTYRKKCEKAITPIIGEERIIDIVPYHITAIVAPLVEQGLARSTIKDYVLIARKIMDVGLEMRIISENPFAKYTVPQGLPSSERRELTRDEICLIRKHWKGNPMGLPALLMMYCGLRRGEMLALQWRDIDLFRKVIHVNKSVSMVKEAVTIKAPKTKNSIRDVPIPDVLHAILTDKMKHVKDASALFCPNADGGYMNETQYKWAWSYYWRYLNDQAGGDTSRRYKKHWTVVIDDITAHMLRHTYASLLYDANVDVKSAQIFLGHSNLTTTLKVYTHLSKKKSDESIASFNAMLNALE